MIDVRITPDFISKSYVQRLERDMGLGGVRALLGVLDILHSRKSRDTPNKNYSCTANVFLDEMKFKTRIFHQNKLEIFLRYCHDNHLFCCDGINESGAYEISLAETTFFYEEK